MKTYDNGIVQLHHGSALDMAFLPDASVDCVVTSPPYWGLRDYGLEPTIWDAEEGCEHEWAALATTRGGAGHSEGERSIHGGDKTKTTGHLVTTSAFCALCPAWRGTLGLEPTPQLYVQHMTQVFREVWRVLKPTGTVWLNLGDSYSGSGGAHTGEHGNPGLSKSASRDGYSRSASNKHTEGLDLPPGLPNRSPFGLKVKDLVGIPWRVAFALQEDGWWLRSDIIWSKPNPMPESVTDRPTKSHEYLFLLTKAERYYYDQEAIREPAQNWGTRERIIGQHFTDGVMLDGSPHKGLKDGNSEESGRNKRSVWTIATQPYPEAHFATFPEALVEPCILAGTSEKGNCAQCGKPSNPAGVGWQPSCSCTSDNVTTVPAVVLDPFAGSGTTCMVAQKLGRHAVGVDQSEEYLKLAKERIGAIPLPLI